MLKKGFLWGWIFVCLFVLVACDEPDPPPQQTPAPTSEVPTTHSVDCNEQSIIDLLEDIPSNGLVINLSDCVYTFDEIHTIPENPDPDGTDLHGIALPVIDASVTINGIGNSQFMRASAEGTPLFRFFYVAPEGSLTINNLTLTNGNLNVQLVSTGYQGGAIFNYSGEVILNGCVLEGNQAVSGGALGSVGGNISISSTSFTDNHSYLEGGAVAVVDQGKLSIDASDFFLNTAELSGGAVYAQGDISVGPGDCVFRENQAGSGGGALTFSGGTAVFENCEFTENTASNGGSVVVYDTTLPVFFTQCIVNNNQVSNLIGIGGGVVLNNVGEVQFSSCLLNFNDAYEGGALHIVNSNVEINNGSRIIGNQVDSNGGGLYMDENSMVTIKTTYLTDNVAGKYGGAIFSLGYLEIYKVNIISNDAIEWLGGGISSHSGIVHIKNSAVVGNSAPLGGGGLQLTDTGSIFNSTFSGNQADGGSAVSFDGDLEVVHGTIARNTSGIGAALFSSRGQATIKNTIIAENSAGWGYAYNCQAAVVAEGDNLDDDGSCTGFNITGNPRLEPLDDNGAYTKNHAITFYSPAFNAVQDCTHLSGGSVTDDQRGVQRPQDEDCDIGAFEKEVMTSQPIPSFIIIQQLADCRSGPGSDNNAMTSFQLDDVAEAVGRNLNQTWYQVFAPQIDDTCWVWAGAVELIGDTEALTIIPVQDLDETNGILENAPSCTEPPGGCPIKESPLCWDAAACACVPCD